MTTQTGVVDKKYTKNLKGKTFYSFNLDDTWYRTGMREGKFEEGDKITFDYEVDEYGNQVDLKTVKVLESGVAQSKPAKAVAKGASSKGVSKDDYWQRKEQADVDRQKIISFQAAFNSATNIVGLALQHEAISLGSAKAKRLGVLKDAVMEIANDLYAVYLSRPSVEVKQVVVVEPDNDEEGESLDD